jgi:ABC-type multidrug transport system fused ATPase/permease subunit
MPLESMAELSTVARAELAIANCDGRVVAAERWSEHIPPGSSDGAGKVDDGPTPGPPPASIAELYQFASGPEKLLLLAGVICALGAGLSMPMMTIAFGNAFEQLGVAETLPGRSVMGAHMTNMLITFVYIGIGYGVGKGTYIASVQYVCSSQMLKYKVAFLKAVLRQDVTWYDSSSPEELTTKFETSMVKIQKGLSAPVFMFFEGMGYGLGSLIMAFVYAPVVSGITLAAVPLLVIPASLMMYLMEHGAKIVNEAYGKVPSPRFAFLVY